MQSKEGGKGGCDARTFGRTKSAAAQALTGLKFITKTGGTAAWTEVETRFNRLTHTTNGLLPRVKESSQFDGELFDLLARKRNISGDSIDKAQLKDFWVQLVDPSFDSRLEIFFDMVDKNADGRITEDEIREIICLSASANKLSDIQRQADEYARLIMEELDPDNLGFIMIEKLEMVLLRGAEQSDGEEGRNLSKMMSEKLMRREEKALKRWLRGAAYFVEDNWKRVWVMGVWMGVMAALF